MKIKVTTWHECIKKWNLKYLVRDLKGAMIRSGDRFDYSMDKNQNIMHQNRDGGCTKIKLLLF